MFFVEEVIVTGTLVEINTHPVRDEVHGLWVLESCVEEIIDNKLVGPSRQGHKRRDGSGQGEEFLPRRQGVELHVHRVFGFGGLFCLNDGIIFVSMPGGRRGQCGPGVDLDTLCNQLSHEL